MKKPMSQNQKIVAYLATGKTLTTYTACVKKLTTKLPTRLGEIAKSGIKIDKSWSDGKEVEKHYVYRLGKNSQKKIEKYLQVK